ncbi:hypothetical protein EAH73_14785 [Hymenobacter nivis]|uniref:AsmA-like C-terminal domain-containing protein n=1 Tax=Hymenobacter nivis TaxID=1850093 RepID=A0A502GR98_9BACT|nr:hypothetical protein EAH73_14785 [Hymenobacter nivis]
MRGATGQLGGHRLGAQQVYFSSQERVFRLDSLRIAPPAPGQGKPGAVRVAMAMPHLVVRGLRAATWQHQHRLVANSARLTGPRLTFRPPAQAPPPLWQLLKPLTKRTDLGRLIIDDGYLAVAGLRHRPVARHVFAVARAIRVDSAAGQPGAKRIVYARAWKGHTGRLTAVFDAPVYPTSAEQLVVDTDAHLLRINNFSVWPVMTAAQLNVHKGYQLSQLTIRLGVLRAQGFDFYTLSDRSQVHIARLVLDRSWMLVGSDARGPLNPHISIMTPEALRKLKAVVDVRQVDVRNGTIATRYRSSSTPLVGTFNLTRFNATLHNFSNDPRRQSFQHPLTGTATAYLQDRCRMELHLSAPMLDPQGRHRLWGSFGAAPFSILNPMTQPTRLIAFKSGDVQRIHFVLNVNRQRATGQVWAEYTGLKFDLLGYKKGEVKKTLWSRVKSGLVNGLVIRDSNPRPSGRLVVGDMEVKRDLRSAAITVWRQGLIRGVLHSAGVPSPLAQKLSQKADQGPLPGHK